MKNNFKKVLTLLILAVGVLVLSGCDQKEDTVKTMICTRTATISDGVKANLKYEVKYKGDYVTTIHSVEKIISDDESYLTAYKESVEAVYEPYKDIEYYDYEVTVDGDTMTSDVTINYEKIDTDKLIDLDSANETLIKDGKILLEDMKTLYESVGTTCK